MSNHPDIEYADSSDNLDFWEGEEIVCGKHLESNDVSVILSLNKSYPKKRLSARDVNQLVDSASSKHRVAISKPVVKETPPEFFTYILEGYEPEVINMLHSLHVSIKGEYPEGNVYLDKIKGSHGLALSL